MYCQNLECLETQPSMSARDIIELQMNGLQLTKQNNTEKGIKLAYRFASPENKQSTGPYHNFKNMLYNPTYEPLLDFDKWEFLDKPTINRNDTKYRQNVIVYKDNVIYIYQFKLSRQYNFEKNKSLYDPFSREFLNMYWRTNSVILLNKKIIR
jgi:hypothetical protein